MSNYLGNISNSRSIDKDILLNVIEKFLIAELAVDALANNLLTAYFMKIRCLIP